MNNYPQYLCKSELSNHSVFRKLMKMGNWDSVCQEYVNSHFCSELLYKK